MGYYNYHAVAKNLIKTGHLTQAVIVESYNKISPALILYYDNHHQMVIRRYRWFEYIPIIEKEKLLNLTDLDY